MNQGFQTALGGGERLLDLRLGSLEKIGNEDGQSFQALGVMCSKFQSGNEKRKEVREVSEGFHLQ